MTRWLHWMILAGLLVHPAGAAHAASRAEGPRRTYGHYVRACLDTLIAHGTDRYGKEKTPLLVSILDVRTRQCPRDPAALDEAYRVIRRGRRNPASADLESDQALLRTMVLYTAATGDRKYAAFARRYAGHFMANLVDDKGFFWWGWHRRYDVFDEKRKGHSGDHHEIHAIHEIDWAFLWRVDPEAVKREIDAIWRWHVVDKKTGEINRHGDGQRGCDFSMSAGAFIEAFAFLYKRTGRREWLRRARLLADYYWARRNPKTDLFPERPNAGRKRFDGSSFVTAVTGLYCHSLLKAWQLTDDDAFRRQAVAYLKAYAQYGYDRKSGKFWGALRLDGTPIPGPRPTRGYAAYEPRGHLELWEPYAAGYQHAIYTAQAYAYAYQLTGEKALLTAAQRFAQWIGKVPPGTIESPEPTWYDAYSKGAGRRGTYAGKYGRTISFLLNLYAVTGQRAHLDAARKTADTAIAKLWHDGLFRGHPAKPYYEAIDGVGYLLYALLQLDLVAAQGEAAASTRTLSAGKRTVGWDNW